MTTTRQRKSGRALTEKDIIRFDKIITFLESQKYAVSKDDICKSLHITSVETALNKLTYYERRLYEDDKGKIGLNNDIAGCLMYIPGPARQSSFNVSVDRSIFAG